MSPRRESRSRPWLTTAGAVGMLAIAVGFGAVNGVMRGGDPVGIDVGWMAAAGPPQSAWLLPSLVLHYVGFGIPALVIASIVAGALILWDRPWGAAYFLAAAIASTALVELLKNGVGRPRPTVALIDVGFGSYPSGHAARAAMLAVTLGVLIPRLWMWMLGAAYTLAVMVSRTQLGAHWLSDTIGGALIGTAVALLCFTLFARPLQNESERAHPPPWKRGR